MSSDFLNFHKTKHGGRYCRHSSGIWLVSLFFDRTESAAAVRLVALAAFDIALGCLVRYGVGGDGAGGAVPFFALC